MKFKSLLTIALLLLSSTAFAERLVLLKLATGQYLAVEYSETGVPKLLGVYSSMQVVSIPENPTLPPETRKIDRVTFVYEKDQGGVPPAVAVGLNKLNSQGILATEFEDDILDGSGEVPDQYKIALEESKKAGIPCLVVQAGSNVVRVVKVTKNTTLDEVLEAAK